MKRLTREHTVPYQKRYTTFEPAITIEAGETILVETINHMTPVVETEADLHPHGSPEYREREETGPIYVNGAKLGDMLAIHIEKIDVVGLPHAMGYGVLAGEYPQKPVAFPVKNGRCILPGGISIPEARMIGEICTMPKDGKPVFYDHGGNMDFTEIRPGNTLYLPVFHEGGLLYVGDVHAAQGDGELLAEGAETAADVTLKIDIDREYQMNRPLVETSDTLIVIVRREGFAETMKLAARDMAGLISRLHGVSEEDAYMLCMVCGSVRIAGSLAMKDWIKSPVIGFSVPKDIRRQ
jgi:amidase